MDNLIPVHILSGFLGSGKTTLLRQWLALQTETDIAVLVNEFGEVGIDHVLLAEIAPDTVLLPGGCVCCQIRGELKDALLTLLERRQRGLICPFNQIVLETTGLADPALILSTLLHDKQLSYHFSPGTLVTVVDAENSGSQANQQPEWIAQITAADRLVISKRQRATAKQYTEVQQRIKQLNPLAPVEDSELLTDKIQSLFSAVETVKNNLLFHPVATQYGTQHRHNQQTETCVIEFSEVLSWPAFAVWLSMLLYCHGVTILRIKGIVRFSESATPVVIQGVQHNLYPPQHLDSQTTLAEPYQLIFILRGLSAEKLRKSFFRFQRAFIVNK